MERKHRQKSEEMGRKKTWTKNQKRGEEDMDENQQRWAETCTILTLQQIVYIVQY